MYFLTFFLPKPKKKARFSDFLNLNELNILHTTPKDMFLSQYKTYGGYDLSERQMAVFLPDALYYEYEYPIQTIEVIPLNKKFSEDLTHRDYLGALMNLGIERCKIGDIIAEDHKALIFVKEEMAEYVTDDSDQTYSCKSNDRYRFSG